MNNVVIYTKSDCVYCKAAKSLLTNNGYSFTEIDVEIDTAALQEMLNLSKNKKTVPQIFFGEEYIGGHSDLLVYFDDRAGSTYNNHANCSYTSIS